MIVAVSPSFLLFRSLALSLVGVCLGLELAAMTLLPTEAQRRDPTGRSAVLAFPSVDGHADVGISLVSNGGRLAGLSLVEVQAHSPWAQAGLQDGDIIRVVDDAAVTDLPLVLDLLTSGVEHSLIYSRDGKWLYAHLTLAPAASTAKNCPAAGTAKNCPAAGTAKNCPAAGTAKNSPLQSVSPAPATRGLEPSICNP